MPGSRGNLPHSPAPRPGPGTAYCESCIATSATPNPQTKTAAPAIRAERRKSDREKSKLVRNAAAKGLGLRRLDLLARQQRIDSVIHKLLGRLVLIVVERADVGHVAVLVEDEDVGRHTGAVLGGQLA